MSRTYEILATQADEAGVVCEVVVHKPLGIAVSCNAMGWRVLGAHGGAADRVGRRAYLWWAKNRDYRHGPAAVAARAQRVA